MFDSIFNVSKSLHSSLYEVIKKNPVLASVHDKFIDVVEQTSGIIIEKWGPVFMEKFPKASRSLEKVVSGLKQFPVTHKIIEVESVESSEKSKSQISEPVQFEVITDESVNRESQKPEVELELVVSDSKTDETDEMQKPDETDEMQKPDETDEMQKPDETDEMQKPDETDETDNIVTRLKNLDKEFLAEKFARNQILKISYIMYISGKTWYSPKEISEAGIEIGFKVLPGNVRKAVSSKGTKLKLVKTRSRRGNKRNSKEMSLTDKGKDFVVESLL